MADGDTAKSTGAKRPQKLGGKVFPTVPLKDAVEHAKKLYNKTMSGPQPSTIILKGVFGSGASQGKIRASSAKQFGFLEGDSKAYKHSTLAKSVSVAAPENIQQFLQQAFLKPSIFRELHSTFVGDQVSKSKIREQAGHRGVHAEKLERCADLFCDSLVFAGLGEWVGDEVRVLPTRASSTTEIVATADASGLDVDGTATSASDDSGDVGEGTVQQQPDKKPANVKLAGNGEQLGPSGRSVIHVNLTLDSTMDTEKLEKQLVLLRKYGAL